MFRIYESSIETDTTKTDKEAVDTISVPSIVMLVTREPVVNEKQYIGFFGIICKTKIGFRVM